ncbi:MAG: hypothetical protein V1865_01860 [bacterium]
MKKYSPKELAIILLQQAQQMNSLGIVEKSTISLRKFRDGFRSIIDKIEKQNISIETNTNIPILFVLPLNMIPLSELIDLTQIDFNRSKINLNKLQKIAIELASVETLHAVIGFKTHYTEKGVHGRINETCNFITSNNGFGFDFAQAITVSYFYPEIFKNEQSNDRLGIDIISDRINGQAPYLIKNGSGKTTILARPWWEASPEDLIVPYYTAEDIITAEN